MQRADAEFCRRQAERMEKLASECVDPGVREKIIALAKEWADRANAKEH
jgi:hypothetical protein